MKRWLFLLVLVAVFTLAAAPASAADAMCEHHDATIAGLHHCVMHAAEMGHISNQGVAQSLLQKLDAAQAAQDRGQTLVAANQLNAFIRAVDAQAGRYIDAMHAGHLVQHAASVIAALGG